MGGSRKKASQKMHLDTLNHLAIIVRVRQSEGIFGSPQQRKDKTKTSGEELWH